MGSLQCKIAKTDESDKMEIISIQKTKNNVSKFHHEIIKIKNPIEKTPRTDRKKLNDILKEPTFQSDNESRSTLRKDFHKKSESKVDKNIQEVLENTPKLKLDLNILKNKNIQSTQQYAVLTKLLGKKKPDETPSKSALDSEKQESIASLKSTTKVQVKKINANQKFKEKEDFANNIKLVMRSKKIQDIKFCSANPSFVNTTENTARRKSQVFIVEPPELTDRSRDTMDHRFNDSRKKSISNDKVVENDSIDLIINKLKNINESSNINEKSNENRAKSTKLMILDDILSQSEMVVFNEKMDQGVSEESSQNILLCVLTKKELKFYKRKEATETLNIQLSKVMKCEVYNRNNYNLEKDLEFIKVIYRLDNTIQNYNFKDLNDDGQNLTIPINEVERNKNEINTPKKKNPNIKSINLKNLVNNITDTKSNKTVENIYPQSKTLILGVRNSISETWMKLINYLISKN